MTTSEADQATKSARLFTAIELSDGVRAAIVAEQRRLVAAFPDAVTALRFVRAEHMHLTLVFIGATAAGRVPEVIEAIQPHVPLAPFGLAFGGIGTFPPRAAPRVVWLGLLEGTERTIELHALVTRRLARAGVAIEQRPYRPHLTLARWRERARGPAPRFSGTGQALARMEVRTVTLFRSDLSPAGPTYTALAHASLGCP